MAAILGHSERVALSAPIKYEVIWTEPAIIDLRTIRTYLNQFNPTAAEKVAALIVSSGNGLTRLPGRGRKVRGFDMREIVTKFPYIIRYRIFGDTVFILRIRHMARRPTRP